MSGLEKQVKFGKDGLVPCVAQDAATGQVLMLAYMNEESFRLTMETGIVHYWSRSRGKLWKKGESSGHVQKLHELRLDCDNDAVLVKIEQIGGAACHTGMRSCFYKKAADGALVEDGVKVFDPDKVYGG